MFNLIKEDLLYTYPFPGSMLDTVDTNTEDKILIAEVF